MNGVVYNPVMPLGVPFAHRISRSLANTEISMIRRFLALTLFTLAAVLTQAQPSLPSSFQAKTIHSPEGADIFVRWGGNGPVVVLIHGYAENSDSWAPLAADLMKDHTVVGPDLRGIGRSSKPDEDTRNFFAATYAQPGGMRAGFAQFTAFSQDAKDNKIFEQTKLTMPVMAVGGEKSFGPLQAVIMRHVATNVQEEVVAGSGHWRVEEKPE